MVSNLTVLEAQEERVTTFEKIKVGDLISIAPEKTGQLGMLLKGEYVLVANKLAIEELVPVFVKHVNGHIVKMGKRVNYYIEVLTKNGLKVVDAYGKRGTRVSVKIELSDS